MQSLIHCIYTSAATRSFEATALATLLQAAREKNDRLGLTGLLLHTEGTFFQVLEGQAEIVDALFATIELDKRHTEVTKIIREPIPHRVFSEWTMGFSEMTRKELAGLNGTNDFFGEARCFTNLDAGRAKKLLDAFREGRWRKRLSGARAAEVG
jgi:Sensors of blue-light using FAD